MASVCQIIRGNKPRAAKCSRWKVGEVKKIQTFTAKTQSYEKTNKKKRKKTWKENRRNFSSSISRWMHTKKICKLPFWFYDICFPPIHLFLFQQEKKKNENKTHPLWFTNIFSFAKCRLTCLLKKLFCFHMISPSVRQQGFFFSHLQKKSRNKNK